MAERSANERARAERERWRAAVRRPVAEQGEAAIESPFSMLVALVLADFAGTDAGAWPSVASLAERCRAGEKTVRRALADLERLGWIVAVERSRSKPTRYVLVVPRVVTLTTRRVVAATTQETGRVVRESSKGGHSDHQTLKEPAVASTVDGSGPVRAREEPSTVEKAKPVEEGVVAKVPVRPLVEQGRAGLVDARAALRQRNRREPPIP